MAECTCADPQAVAQAIGKTLTGQIKGDDERFHQDITAIHETLYGKESYDAVVDPATGEESKGPGGTPGRIDRIRFCHWAAPEYGPTGESVWTDLFQAAELAISLLNALIQGQIADLKQDLAEGYYNQALSKWNRFANKYMPLERDILWEAQSEPIKELDCDDDDKRAKQDVNTAFNIADRDLPGLAKQYKLCLDDSAIRQLGFARSRLYVDTLNYNLRDDQWFVDFKNDQRWNRRSNILNLGRNLGAVAMQYGDVARSLMDNVSNQANKAFGSVSQALGYYGAKFDTSYPTQYLAGSMSQLVTTNTRLGYGASSEYSI